MDVVGKKTCSLGSEGGGEVNVAVSHKRKKRREPQSSVALEPKSNLVVTSDRIEYYDEVFVPH